MKYKVNLESSLGIIGFKTPDAEKIEISYGVDFGGTNANNNHLPNTGAAVTSSLLVAIGSVLAGIGTIMTKKRKK